MKKNSNILFFFFLVFYFFTKGIDIFPLIVAFFLGEIIYFLNNNIFFSASQNDSDKNKYDLLIRYNIFLTISFILYLFFTYILSKIINIRNLFSISIVIIINNYFTLLFKYTYTYLEDIGLKKSVLKIKNTYNYVIIFVMIAFLLFRLIIKNQFYFTISLLILVLILSKLFLIIIMQLILKKNKKLFKIDIKSFLNIKKYKKVLENKEKHLINVFNLAKIYTNIVILYYILNRYGLNYSSISSNLSYSYFYFFVISYLIFKNSFVKLDLSKDYYANIKLILSKFLTLSIFLLIMSFPIINIFFKGTFNYFLFIIPFLFIKTITYYNQKVLSTNKENLYITIFSYLLNILFIIPFIGASYRMGYNLIFGSFLSLFVSSLSSFLLSFLIIKNKYKQSKINFFNKILEIIYHNLLYLMILIIFITIFKPERYLIGGNLLIIFGILIITFVYKYTQK